MSEPTLYEQTLCNPVNGDCMRAAIATMMQWDPAELPNFVEDDDPWTLVYKTGIERGYELLHQHPHNAAAMNQSPTGWCMATVPSLKFPGENHSLVVDATTLALVHDPNPPKWRRDTIKQSDMLTCLIAIRVKEATDE